MNQQILKLLHDVRRRLTRTGWRKGTSRDTRRKCILDIIDAVSDTTEYKVILEAEDTMKRLICAEDFNCRYTLIKDNWQTTSIAQWNDDPKRKFKEVINLLDISISIYTSELNNEIKINN